MKISSRLTTIHHQRALRIEVFLLAVIWTRHFIRFNVVRGYFKGKSGLMFWNRCLVQFQALKDLLERKRQLVIFAKIHLKCFQLISKLSSHEIKQILIVWKTIILGTLLRCFSHRKIRQKPCYVIPHVTSYRSSVLYIKLLRTHVLVSGTCICFHF